MKIVTHVKYLGISLFNDFLVVALPLVESCLRCLIDAKIGYPVGVNPLQNVGSG